MSYANGKLICDADSHLMELPDFLTAFANADVRPLLPDLGAALTGQFEPGQYSRKVGHSAEQVAKLMALGDNLTKGPKWHEALGAFNGNERAKALDQLGFAKQVIFSSFCARLIFDAKSDAAAYGAAEAHNRAMADYCDADDRLMGVAMVPLQDVSRAQEEIERALELGLCAVWIPADAPGGRSPGHPSHDPLWARLEEAGVPFILHVGSAPLTIGDAWMNDGKLEVMSARGGAEVIGSKDLTTIHFAAHRFLSTLVIEIGAGWVPDMLRRLDHAVDIWSRSEPQLAKMKRTPSEQAKDQLRFTPYPFEDVATLVGESCPELYLFSSDYPHAEGGRDPLGRFSRTTADLSEVDRQKFFAGNFFDLYPNA
jgi:predicted TIM-barrel fold metal-dependent hydrolase